MQATIGNKAFTRALACLCRYGDEITIHPTAEWLSLSVQGVGNTSFCRFKFLRTFFDRGYRVGSQPGTARPPDGSEDETDPNFTDEAVDSGDEDEVQEIQQVFGMVPGKLVLSVLRGSAVEKSADKCHLQFVEGIEPTLHSAEEDSIETRLVLTLQYKHGVIKTHTFSLSASQRPQAPRLPSNRPISSVCIGGRTLKELIEHFPRPERSGGGGSGHKSDPLLIWQFHDNKACIKTEDRWSSARSEWNAGTAKGGRRAGKALLGADADDDEESLIYSTVNSQLTLQDSEFESYDIFYAPVTLGVHLKELNATLSVAEALGSDIVLRFTASGQPIFFSLESSMGTYNAFCALSTKVVPDAREDGKQPSWGTNDGTAKGNGNSQSANGNETGHRKRQREADGAWQASKRKPGMDSAAVSNGVRTPTGTAPSASTTSRPRSGSYARPQSDLEGEGGDEQLSFAGVATSTQPGGNPYSRIPSGDQEDGEPLFLPEATPSVDNQTEPPASQVLRDAGLQDFERMTQAELEEVLGDDDVDMDGDGGDEMNWASSQPPENDRVEGAREYYAPTQRSRGDDFEPLFRD